MIINKYKHFHIYFHVMNQNNKVGQKIPFEGFTDKLDILVCISDPPLKLI